MKTAAATISSRFCCLACFCLRTDTTRLNAQSRHRGRRAGGQGGGGGGGGTEEGGLVVGGNLSSLELASPVRFTHVDVLSVQMTRGDTIGVCTIIRL